MIRRKHALQSCSRFLALSAAAALLLAARAILAGESVAEGLRWHVFESDRHLGQAELLLYASLSILGLPAAFLLGKAWPESWWSRLSALIERAGYGVPVVFAAGGAFLIARAVTHQAWFTDDEQAYLFQMHGYRQLQLVVPALQPEQLFPHTFILTTRVIDGVPHWTSIYPFMQPALMALSSVFGNPLVSQWLCVGGIVLASGKLAECLTLDRRFGLAAAWLCGTSPMLVGLGATYHNAIPTCLFSMLTLHAYLAARRSLTVGAGAVLGAAAGATFLTRPLEGFLAVTLAAGALVWTGRTQPRLLMRALSGFAATGACAFAIYAAVNQVTTGHFLDNAYAVWARRHGDIMGFRENMMWGRSHSIALGMTQTFAIVTRMNSWLFGWPVSFFVPLLALLLPLRSRAPLWILALCGLHLASYFPLAFGGVHDFGSAYYVWHVPLLAAVTACVMQGARGVIGRSGARLALGLTVAGLVVFWPTQIQKWHAQAEATLMGVREVRRVTGGRKAIVLHRGTNPPGTHSWVHDAPTSFPGNPLWWALDVPGAPETMRRLYPDRALFRLSWVGPNPRVSPLDGQP